jgi:hypothetical protein
MRATEVLDITHGRYTIEDSGVPVPAENNEPDRIIEPGQEPGNGALIRTGTFYGPVEVTVEVLDAPPTQTTGEDWERVEEVTLTAAGDLIGLVPLADDPPESLPEMTINPGERYSLRVYVRGYKAGQERPQYNTGEPPVESHLVQLWPGN